MGGKIKLFLLLLLFLVAVNIWGLTNALCHSPSSPITCRQRSLCGLTVRRVYRKGRTQLLMTSVVADISKMSVKQALVEVCGSTDLLKPPLNPNVDRISHTFKGVQIERSSPTVCRYVIANPQAFLSNPGVASLYGFDAELLSLNTPLTDLAALLPVIYIAEEHPEYGTLGLMLNKRNLQQKMGDIYPALRSFRNRPIYLGGAKQRGSSFTMVHKRAGFPDNRAWKGLPDSPDFKLFFSPNLAMANELCMTNDADPKEFKFFQWGTIWQPRQLDLEYDKKLWITIRGPPEIIFDDDQFDLPLWRRVVLSLPPGILGTRPATQSLP